MVQVSEGKLSIGKYINNCNSVEEADDLKKVLPHFLKAMSFILIINSVHNSHSIKPRNNDANINKYIL